MLPDRSHLQSLVGARSFVWATGIDDTIITIPWPGTGRTLDQYQLTDHYRRWADDLALMAELGVGAARYGIPWHRVNPAPGRWEWSWADRCIERMLELGIDPIIDLLHYGLPTWLEGAYLAPEFPARLAEFAACMAGRYRGRVRWYTPVNEPRITAWYCGKLGWWPPQRRGWRGFVAVMMPVARAIAATVRTLRTVDPGIVDVHVDATDRYSSPDPGLAQEVEFRQELNFLALDLASGRVDAAHPLHGWLMRNGAAPGDLELLRERAIEPAVIGLNFYPLFSQKVLLRSPRGLRTRMPYAPAAVLDDLAERYWRRYGRPLMITETATSGSVARRMAWLEDSVAVVRGLRERGVPMVGYTWWPMFALVSWAYRQGRRPVADYLQRMGLWDLGAPGDDLARVRTPLVDAYARLTATSAGSATPFFHELAHVP
jgi:beta-glucosidase/6-phospho-beta-glucosidase/beta-galactosidase